jgi:hypothetical protein
MRVDVRRLSRPEPQALAAQIAAGRLVFAAVIMAAPVFSARLLGADTATAQRVTWLTRMMAVRDGALGAGGVAAVRRGGAAPWLLAGAVSDAADAVVIAVALEQGRLKGIVATLVVPAAAATAAAGVVTALQVARAKS